MQQQATEPLRITSWNALNAAYENEEYYTEDTYPHLKWHEGRDKRAVLYLSQLQSDILQLQEVSHAMATTLMQGLNAQMSGSGADAYVMLWEPRTAPDAEHNDGCAILHKPSKFHAVGPHFVWRYPSGKHIALSCLFDVLGSRRLFWAVDTHVNWKTRNEDLLALQHQLNSNSEFLGAGDKALPKVVMGDFNAVRGEAWYSKLGENGLIDALGDVAQGPLKLIDGEEARAWPYTYNSGKSSKFIDFALLHRLDRSHCKGILVGNDWRQAERFDAKSLPSAEVPSDHLPVSILLDI